MAAQSSRKRKKEEEEEVVPSTPAAYVVYHPDGRVICLPQERPPHVRELLGEGALETWPCVDPARALWVHAHAFLHHLPRNDAAMQRCAVRMLPLCGVVIEANVEACMIS